MAASEAADTLALVPARVYAIANQKGGVGKTTTAVNVGACLAEAGERVLLIDLDPQANASSGLGVRANGTSTHDLLDGAPLSALAHPTRFPNLDLVAAKSNLAAAAVELSGLEGGERYLADALDGSLDAYSFVFLDCPPSFGPLTVNALAAASRAIVPVQAEYYALEGLSQLMGTINLVKARLNPELAVVGVLLTMADGRTRLSSEVEAEIRNHFGDGACRAFISRSAAGRNDAGWAVGSKSFSARARGSPSCCTSRSSRSTRTPASRAEDSSRRRRQGSPRRSSTREFSSPSSCAGGRKAAMSS